MGAGISIGGKGPATSWSNSNAGSQYSQPFQQYRPLQQTRQFYMPAPQQQRQQQTSPTDLSGILGVSNLLHHQQSPPNYNRVFKPVPQQQLMNYQPPQYSSLRQYQQDPYISHAQNQQLALQQRAVQSANIQNTQQNLISQQQAAARQSTAAQQLAAQQAAALALYNASQNSQG
jgi:hypothetical protein